MFDFQYAIEIFPTILSALRITISATIVGFILAFVLGLVLAMLSRTKVKTIATITNGVIKFIRNTPLLVQLYFIFYVFPSFGLTLSPFVAGVLGLGIHYSTYLSEVFRSGIDAVPVGQWEVGKALNFTQKQTWTRIILPQAVPPIVPVIGNYFITMFKETPLLSAITLVEILQQAKILGANSFSYVEPITIVGILFFVLSYPASLLIKQLENKLNKKYQV
ncbi:MAG: ectoine/hydroxyectoine ABC transporter permease subunit EhuD [Desemzia incerta]|uniref:Amino acid ABC transporter membrane protein 2, PAAT family n=1 Tax=Desemzia incerta TaxID=82801 RepID=A0A1I5VB93_9LACT|nr:ectoine/hydroxyectoine ABC transporter permease subunit EhuD [Desemzia incerta]SFQ04789.1 amino acid ABC transporter membrane protein 2, PAAT family [Desemzia incerta]